MHFVKFHQINSISSKSSSALLTLPLLLTHFPYLLELNSISGFIFFIPNFPFPSWQTDNFPSENVSCQDHAHKVESNNLWPGRTKGRSTGCVLPCLFYPSSHIFLMFINVSKRSFPAVNSSAFLSFNTQNNSSSCHFMTSLIRSRCPSAAPVLQLSCQTKPFWLLHFFAPLWNFDHLRLLLQWGETQRHFQRTSKPSCGSDLPSENPSRPIAQA